MRTKKKGKLLSDAGIRLKVVEPNLLLNYSKHLKLSKKGKKKKKKKSSLKQVKIKSKMDPMEKITDEVDKKEKEKEEIVIKTITVSPKAKELSETDPNVKRLKITASVEPEKKKKGGGIII